MISRSVDPAGDFIVVKAIGPQTIESIRYHYDALRQMIAPLRASGKPIRILSDVTESVVRSAEFEAVVEEEMRRTFDPAARVAILTSTGDDQTHLRVLASGSNVVPFQSRLAAELWLCSDVAPPQATEIRPDDS